MAKGGESLDCIKIKSGTSLLRVFHAAPQSLPVDVYINEKLAFSNLKYKEFSNYKILSEGEYRIDVFVAGDMTKPIISGALELEEGKILTIAAIGDRDKLELLVIDDHSDKFVNTEKSSFRAVHLSPNTPNIDIYVNGKDLITDLEYKQNTSYLDVKQDRYNMDVVLSESEMMVLCFSSTLKVDRIYTIYIIGDLPNLEAIQSVDGNTYLCKS